MMCYKDRTFCMAKTCQHFGNGCDRSLTDEVLADAKKWWGDSNTPISIFCNTPDCYEAERVEDITS